MSFLLKYKLLSEYASPPAKGSECAAGYDLRSAEDAIVPAHGSCLIKTDLQLEIPTNGYGRIAPRSGLAVTHFIDVGAGVVDPDYRGNVCVLLFNFSEVDFKVKVGDRIAQLIIEAVLDTELLEVDRMGSTARGSGGFGSTGILEEILPVHGLSRSYP